MHVDHYHRIVLHQCEERYHTPRTPPVIPSNDVAPVAVDTIRRHHPGLLALRLTQPGLYRAGGARGIGIHERSGEGVTRRHYPADTTMQVPWRVDDGVSSDETEARLNAVLEYRWGRNDPRDETTTTPSRTNGGASVRTDSTPAAPRRCCCFIAHHLSFEG
jgi:hypothetical protein